MKIRHLTVAGVVAFGAFTLTACGPDASPAAAPADSAAAPASVSATQGGAPVASARPTLTDVPKDPVCGGSGSGTDVTAKLIEQSWQTIREFVPDE